MYIVNSKQIADKRTAIETAFKQDITTIFDTVNNSVITLPTKQRTGTTTQQKAYITSVIDKLCK
jgi:hypothetical protein